MSQERLWQDSQSPMNDQEVQALKQQFGLVWKYRKKEYGEAKMHVIDGAEQRGRRQSTERERRMARQQKIQKKALLTQHQSIVDTAKNQVDYFNNMTLDKLDPHAAGITQIDNAAVRKPIGAPCTLFL
jgi:hypothetical protein|tara:strand:+ start:312 stop:695 length:384 start_codon:yes stop_codon:yes gene_type:complete